jgi:hypothetical protein
MKESKKEKAIRLMGNLNPWQCPRGAIFEIDYLEEKDFKWLKRHKFIYRAGDRFCTC